MTYDERDRREEPQEPDGREPDWAPSDQPTEPMEPIEPAEAPEPAEAREPAEPVEPEPAEPTEPMEPATEPDEPDEFETPSWPHQDAAAEESAEASPEEPESAPPPSDVEAYTPPPEPSEPGMPAHSVPATEPGESTQCPRCGTENRPGISFCRNCGQRLVAAGAPATVARPAAPDGTQACPRCGTHNRAGTAFCQNCGANLRPAEPGYVPPAVPAAAAQAEAEGAAGRALLGPIVLLIGAIGIATGWLLPFHVGDGSLWNQSFGRSDGYGIAFWSAYDGIATLAEQAYFGFAAAAPLLILLLVVLAVAGFLRPGPAVLQHIGLLVALVWAIGLVALFILVELVGGPGGELLDILRGLSPGGIILMLASLIVVIGVLTRFGRG